MHRRRSLAAHRARRSAPSPSARFRRGAPACRRPRANAPPARRPRARRSRSRSRLADERRAHGPALVDRQGAAGVGLARLDRSAHGEVDDSLAIEAGGERVADAADRAPRARSRLRWTSSIFAASCPDIAVELAAERGELVAALDRHRPGEVPAAEPARGVEELLEVPLEGAHHDAASHAARASRKTIRIAAIRKRLWLMFASMQGATRRTNSRARPAARRPRGASRRRAAVLDAVDLDLAASGPGQRASRQRRAEDAALAADPRLEAREALDLADQRRCRGVRHGDDTHPAAARHGRHRGCRRHRVLAADVRHEATVVRVEIDRGDGPAARLDPREPLPHRGVVAGGERGGELRVPDHAVEFVDGARARVRVDAEGRAQARRDARVGLALLAARGYREQHQRHCHHRQHDDDQEEEEEPAPEAHRTPTLLQSALMLASMSAALRAASRTPPGGYSSAGRAPGSHPGGRRFESG